jgi:hypothetical protein
MSDAAARVRNVLRQRGTASADPRIPLFRSGVPDPFRVSE